MHILLARVCKLPCLQFSHILGTMFPFFLSLQSCMSFNFTFFHRLQKLQYNRRTLSEITELSFISYRSTKEVNGSSTCLYHSCNTARFPSSNKL